MKDLSLPSGLELWTADEVAECLSYHDFHVDGDQGGWALYSKLWGFLDDAKNPTPMGGDGSDGTVETPCGRLSRSNDDKALHWWSALNDDDKEAIIKAHAKEQIG
tara:strand:+ start:1243 stop:1557 length:315 start_codon:yes stop_codon:yes gene_type:complete